MTDNVSSSSNSGGIGFLGLLTIVFITLKLTHFIAWSWWWVLSPILIPLSILCVILIVALIALGVAAIADHYHDTKTLRVKRRQR